MVGCSRVPKSCPRVFATNERVGYDFWLSAPDVVVVQVRAVRLVGPKIRLPSGADLRLVEIDAAAETIISGSLQPGPARFYTFADLPFFKELRIHPDERCVVFLRREGEVLRTMADLDRSEVPLYSGFHNTTDLPDMRSVAERVMPCLHRELAETSLTAMRIAYVALTPGRDSSPDSLVASIRGVGRLWPMAPNQYVVWLLKQLAASSNARVRGEACLALAEHPAGAGADACLVEVARGSDAEMRRRAEEVLAVHARNTPQLVETLKTWPASLSPGVVDLAGRLEFLASHRDDQVRSLACKALSDFFPACSFPECRSAKLRSAGSR